MKVFVSAGHGGSDPGAVGNGLLEKDCNLFIALAFGDVLESVGVDVVYSRKKDENDPVSQEVIEANHSQCDYAISFHNNAGGGVGSETWIWPGDNKALKIAEAFEKVTVDAGAKSRGVKTTQNLYFIRNTYAPAILNESAFIDSKDYVRIDSPEKCTSIGKRYAYAFLEAVGIDTDQPASFQPFQIKAKNKKLYVYAECNRNSKVTYTIEDKRRYTVVDKYEEVRELETWYKLKSGVGWVNADDVIVIE